MKWLSWNASVAFAALLPAALFLLPLSSQAAEYRVVRPEASFVDVAARRVELKSASTPRVVPALGDLRSCNSAAAPAPSGRIFIPDRYQSGGHGATNPKEREASQPYYSVQNQVSYGANRYLVTGDPKEAVCVVDVIDAWAAAGALLDYNAAEEPTPVLAEVGWTTSSLALAYSVVAAEPLLDPAKKAAAVDWLRRVAYKMIRERRAGHAPANENNLSYWRGLAAAAVGVIAKDDELFTWGLEQYKRAIGQLQPDGSWPLEMDRHELAVHYEDFALQPLVLLAELAARQGIDLYGYKANGHTLADAVHFVALEVKGPSLAQKLSGSEQKIDSNGRDFFSWLEFWNRRFGDAGLGAYLDRPWFAARLSGSSTLYAAAGR